MRLFVLCLLLLCVQKSALSLAQSNEQDAKTPEDAAFEGWRDVRADRIIQYLGQGIEDRLNVNDVVLIADPEKVQGRGAATLIHLTRNRDGRYELSWVGAKVPFGWVGGYGSSAFKEDGAICDRGVRFLTETETAELFSGLRGDWPLDRREPGNRCSHCLETHMLAQTNSGPVRHHFVSLYPTRTVATRSFPFGKKREQTIEGFAPGGAADFAYRLRGLVDVSPYRECETIEKLPRNAKIERLAAERMQALYVPEKQAEKIESDNQETLPE